MICGTAHTALLCLVVCSAFLLTAFDLRQAAAQESPPSTARSASVQRAEERFDEGVRAFTADRYADALAAFEESYELNPLAMVLHNIAMCQRALEDYAASIRTFRRYLQEAYEEIEPDQRSEIRRLISQMSRQLAELDVRTNVPGATILADDEEVGITPLEASLSLVVGTHIIVARLIGHEEAREEVRLRQGETSSLQLVLEPVAGSPDAEPARERSVARSWWLWTIVSAVLVAGAATLTVLLWPDDETSADWSVQLR